MSRKIKFRAWDHKEKKMIPSIGLTEDGTPFIMRSIYKENTGQETRKQNASCVAFDKEEIEIMQFTGLKDKNGKEIYEGDIVKRRYFPLGADPKVIEYCKIGIVVYQDNYFGLQLKIDGTKILNEERASYYQRTESKVYKHPTQGLDWVDKYIHPSDSEIIGNLFEHPHLLK